MIESCSGEFNCKIIAYKVRCEKEIFIITLLTKCSGNHWAKPIYPTAALLDMVVCPFLEKSVCPFLEKS